MHRPRVRDASAVQGVFLTIGLAIAAFFPFLALYLRDAHGLDESQIGLVLACMAAARMVANPLWGHLSDTRIGRLTALQIGLAGSGPPAVRGDPPAGTRRGIAGGRGRPPPRSSSPRGGPSPRSPC